MIRQVPELRILRCNDRPIRRDGRFVLYWMLSARRPDWNFALQRAVEWSVELQKPLVILEAVRVDYPWASERFHRFMLDGMAHHQEAFATTAVRYYPYVEDKKGSGKGLLAAMAREASLVITDDFPCFIIPKMVAAAARRVSVRLEAVDGNGLLPLRAVERIYPSAYTFRHALQRLLAPHLKSLPKANPLSGVDLVSKPAIPRAILARWPPAAGSYLRGSVSNLPIDHSVPAVDYRGGAREAKKRLKRFLGSAADGYKLDASKPEADATSRLSPYLHFGNISPHQIFRSINRREGWSMDRLSGKAGGKRSGWWGMSASAEAFLDQLVTWRELGFNYCAQRDDYTRYESLPPWALETLEAHRKDPRDFVYDHQTLEIADTHDPLWNAAQTQLRTDGYIQNYLRMLWGKKILEWSPDPSEAMRVMIALNDKYAVDGRDPNSYSGISWVLGRYDRPWGPERPIFGKIRYMSSKNTQRKFSVRQYMARYASSGGPVCDSD